MFKNYKLITDLKQINNKDKVIEELILSTHGNCGIIKFEDKTFCILKSYSKQPDADDYYQRLKLSCMYCDKILFNELDNHNITLKGEIDEYYLYLELKQKFEGDN